MSCGGRRQWPLLGMISVVLLLSFHLPGVTSRCIDMALGQDLQPLPPGVQRCSLPQGLLQPDVGPPGQRMDSGEAGDSRVVGGSPAVSGGSQGGGSPAYPPSGPGGTPSPFGKPNKPWPFGPPGKSHFGGVSGQYGTPEKSHFGGVSGQYGPPGKSHFGGVSGQYGPPGKSHFGGVSGQNGRPSGPEQYGGPATYGRPDGPGQYDGSYGDGPYRRPRVEMKPPGIPYIPSAREWGGGRIPVQNVNPGYGNNPSASYGGGAGSYNSGGRYPPTYGGGSGASGMRGRYDGSYGPVPYGSQPGGHTDRDSGSDPCTPDC